MQADVKGVTQTTESEVDPELVERSVGHVSDEAGEVHEPTASEVDPPESRREWAEGLAAPPPPSREQLIEMSDKIKKGKATEMDLLVASLAALIADPIAMNFRMKDRVATLMNQASTGVSIITTLAERLGVEYDESPVRATNAYSEWTHKELDQLGGFILAKVGAITSRSQHVEEEMANARSKLTTIERTVQEYKDRIIHLQNSQESQRRSALEGMQRLHGIIAGFHDQDYWVMAMTKPETGEPTKFVRETPEGAFVPVDFRGATKYQTSEDAWEGRDRMLQVRSKINPKLLRVMRMSIHPVEPDPVEEG